jgi:nitrite reductase/ring-hydroxylating ferredoxin subunit
MLSTADNELLVRVGRGTPLNDLYRRFWTPVMLASELGGPDSPPVRVHVLDERLVAFRDTSGAIGLLAAYCPHRRANLFWGRNEEHGLRCVYHGWKFDRSGQCIDMPNCPEGPALKERVRTTAYPTLERGALVWAYLGPPELQPPFPHMEIFELPAEQVETTKMLPLGTISNSRKATSTRATSRCCTARSTGPKSRPSMPRRSTTMRRAGSPRKPRTASGLPRSAMPAPMPTTGASTSG